MNNYIRRILKVDKMKKHFENYEYDGDCTNLMPLPNQPKKYVEQDIGQNEYQE